MRELALFHQMGNIAHIAMMPSFMNRMRNHARNDGFALFITNEANLTGGENIGGSTAAPDAPEAATDDDAGDGDGDPEPERRRSAPRTTRTASLPPTVEHFDRLPESAHVNLHVLKAITGRSRATIYRWIASGILPKPRKLGATHNCWTAGEIRQALAAAK